MRRNLVVLDRAGRRGGAGWQSSGGANIRVAGAAPPEKGERGRSALGAYPRLLAGGVALEHWDGQLPSSQGLFVNTHSQKCLGLGLSTREASAARGPETTKKRPPPGSGRESCAPSSPATSLRPLTALGRSCYGSIHYSRVYNLSLFPSNYNLHNRIYTEGNLCWTNQCFLKTFRCIEAVAKALKYIQWIK